MSTIFTAGTATMGAIFTSDATGSLQFQTGSTPTTAFTLDSSRNATFAGGVGIGGAASPGSTGLAVTGTLSSSSLTSGRVTYAGTGGLLQDSANLTFNGTTLTAAGFSGPISGVVTSTSITDSGLTSGRVTYATTGGLLTDSANLTFNGTTLTTNTLNLTNALTTAYGGTGLSSYTAGDLPYYASGTALSKLGIGTSGQILTSSGTAPQWSTLSGVAVTTFSAGTTGFTPSSATSGAITLAGTLGTTNGGTGLTSFTVNGVVYASSTSALTTGSTLVFDGNNLGVLAGSVTTPASKLHVVGNVRSSNGAGTVYTQLSSDGVYSTATDLFLFAPTGYANIFYANSAEQMRLNSTGLGIGTSSPSEKLTVNGNIKLGTSGTSWIYGPSTTGRSILSNSDSSAYLTVYGSSYGTGQNSILQFVTGTSNPTTLDASGNLGLGVTPSAWSSTFKALQLPNGGSFSTGASSVQISWNAYYNAGWKYIAASTAANYYQQGNTHVWRISADVTPVVDGAITWTQAMTLDASGNLGIGVTSPTQKLTVNSIATIKDTGNSAAQLTFAGSGSDFYGRIFYNLSTNTMQFFVNSAEAARIDSSGNLGIGTTSPSQKLTVAGGIASTASISALTASSVFFDLNSGNGRFAAVGSTTTTPAIITLSQYSSNGSVGRDAVIIDSSGNLGLGVTPSAWYTTGGTSKWFEIPNGVSFGGYGGSTTVGNNWYANTSGGDIYKITGYAAQYVQTSGTHVWKIAGVGNAGNAITFTQAMTLNALGQVLIGTASTPYSGATGTGVYINGVSNNQPDLAALFVAGAKIGYAGIQSLIQNQLTVYDNTAGNGAGTGGAIAFGGNAGGGQGTYYAAIESRKDNGTAGAYGASLNFYTRPDASYYTSPNMTISSGGNVGIGTTSPGAKLEIGGTNPEIRLGPVSASSGAYMSYNTAGNYFSLNAVTQGVSYRSICFATDGGSVGIGTTSPAYKLDVSGNVSWLPGVSGAPRGYLSGASSDQSIEIGTTTNSPLGFTTNGTRRLTIDTSGNLGLGVTPSAWGSYKALEVAGVGHGIFATAGTGSEMNISCNAYYNAGFKYAYSDLASYYSQSSGKHYWFTAPSGTAGNTITWTQAMTLDASGNLGIGTNNPTHILDINQGSSPGTGPRVYGNSSPGYQVYESSSGITLFLGNDSSACYISAQTNNPLVFRTNSTERGRIDSSGNFNIGDTSAYGKLTVHINGSTGVNNGSGSATRINDFNNATIVLHNQDSAGTGAKAGLFFAMAGSPGVASGIAGYKESGTWGTGLQFYTNNITGGSYTDVITERMRITSNGSVGIGTISPGYKLEVAGNAFATGITISTGGGTNVANTVNIDTNGSGTARYYSHGANASTKGSHEWHLASSDGSLDTTGMTLTSASNLSVGGSISVGTSLDVGNGINFAAGAIRTAIYTLNTYGGNQYIHMKTDQRTNNSNMYRFELTGYDYGSSQVLAGAWGGYLYSGSDNSIANATANWGNRTVCNSVYRSSDGYLVLVADIATYYCSFIIHFQAGATGNFSPTITSMYQSTSTSAYF